ncbi:Sperm motility kinase [Sciurus carolinensis]|uniref:non-specific serine/threonine protein kinase n=1 Tax=Sciurus carolinensis TaxID=30640 RepID=A0AA41T9Y1_SCICA|nr:Sperm motility kinase [Sciurus carolinensis]
MSKGSESSVALQRQSCWSEPAFGDHDMVLQDTGTGGFTQVKLACHLLTGTVVLAIVAWNFPYLTEPDIVVDLDNPNVIHLFQVIETKDYIFLIMERVGGEQLWDLIAETDGMQEEDACRLFRQIMQAMQHCHTNGILHLDLKPENVVVDTSSKVKLIDFGLSTRFTARKKLKKFGGTALYVAPEIVCEKASEPPAPQQMSGARYHSLHHAHREMPILGKKPEEGEEAGQYFPARLQERAEPHP